jgi:hypothetical protein
MKSLGQSVVWKCGRYFKESEKGLDASPDSSLEIIRPNQAYRSFQMSFRKQLPIHQWTVLRNDDRPQILLTRSSFFISTLTSPIHHVRATSKALPNKRDLALHLFVYKNKVASQEKLQSSANHTTIIRRYTKLWTTLAEGPTALVR